jgi:hypothetical protein
VNTGIFLKIGDCEGGVVFYSSKHDMLKMMHVTLNSLWETLQPSISLFASKPVTQTQYCVMLTLASAEKDHFVTDRRKVQVLNIGKMSRT